MYLIKGDQRHWCRNTALIAVSIFANRKVYEENKDGYFSLITNIKENKKPRNVTSWNDYDVMNVHVDEFGITNTLMTTNVCLYIYDNYDHDTAAPRQNCIEDEVAHECNSIFGEIGLPVSWLFESHNYVSSIATIKTIGKDGTFSTGRDANMRSIPLVIAKSGTRGVPFRIDISRQASRVSRSNTQISNVTRLTSIIVDIDGIFVGKTGDQIDTGSIQSYVSSARILTPTYPLSILYNTPMTIDYRKHVQPESRTPHDKYFNDINAIKWCDVTSIAVDPDQYSSINALLKLDKTITEYNNEIKQYAPQMTTDVCVKCKTLLCSDIYVLENHRGYHVALCALCAHLSNVLDMIDKTIKYKILRTTHPRTLSDFIDSLGNPRLYSDCFKMMAINIPCNIIKKRLGIEIIKINSNNDITDMLDSIGVVNKPIVVIKDSDNYRINRY